MMPNRTFALLFSVLLLPACERGTQGDANADQNAPHDQAAENAPPSAGAPVAPGDRPALESFNVRNTAEVDAKLGNVILSDSGDAESSEIGAPTTSFEPSDTVYALVETDGTAPYVLYAKWIDSSGTVLSDYGVQVTETGARKTVISLSKPDGWSPGQNRVELAINGQQGKIFPFEVR